MAARSPSTSNLIVLCNLLVRDLSLCGSLRRSAVKDGTMDPLPSLPGPTTQTRGNERVRSLTTSTSTTERIEVI